MDKYFITKEQAKNLLKKDIIHTYRNTANMLIGCDWTKEDLFKLIENCDPQIGGDKCKAMKHGLVLNDDAGYLFVECDNEDINKIEY